MELHLCNVYNVYVVSTCICLKLYFPCEYTVHLEPGVKVGKMPRNQNVANINEYGKQYNAQWDNVNLGMRKWGIALEVVKIAVKKKLNI